MAVKKLGELLVESGLISQEQLDETLKEIKVKGQKLGSALVKKGYASEMDIAQTLSFQLNIPFVDIESTLDPKVLDLIPETIPKKYLLIPLYQDGKTLNIGMSDPLNLHAIDDIRFATGLAVRPYVVTITDVVAAINKHYNLSEPIEDLMSDFKKDKCVEVVHDREYDMDLSQQIKKSAAPPIIKMVDSIIIQAVDNRASDIHLEPQDTNVRLRFRVDGIMREVVQFPKWVQGPVISRIKLMARMDIAERRVSQDGRIKVRIGDKNIDLRVSTLPTQYGETIVLRILDTKEATLSIKSVGLSKEDLKRVTDMVSRPQGVVIATGPTGSGKTSTLYSIIGHIKSEKINIITIEDPIEYELKGVSQVPVNEKTGLTFSYTLRSVLRQDPDVILVGEMRDAETAIIAHQASMTGHLVFTTLHTNDAVSSIIRLKNMGIPQYMIASALNGIIAQRLVRSICNNCKEAYTPKAEEMEFLGNIKPQGGKLYRGKGCNKCGNSGYFGRTGVFEVMAINSKLKKLIAADAHEEELLDAAIEAGMIPLHTDGLKKAASGVTTIEELSRVVYIKDDESRHLTCPACSSEVSSSTRSCPGCGYIITESCPTCGKHSSAL